jgi:hypothetical protein
MLWYLSWNRSCVAFTNSALGYSGSHLGVCHPGKGTSWILRSPDIKTACSWGSYEEDSKTRFQKGKTRSQGQVTWMVALMRKSLLAYSHPMKTAVGVWPRFLRYEAVAQHGLARLPFAYLCSCPVLCPEYAGATWILPRLPRFGPLGVSMTCFLFAGAIRKDWAGLWKVAPLPSVLYFANLLILTERGLVRGDL